MEAPPSPAALCRSAAGVEVTVRPMEPPEGTGKARFKVEALDFMLCFAMMINTMGDMTLTTHALVILDTNGSIILNTNNGNSTNKDLSE
jgi:hypothetical protein